MIRVIHPGSWIPDPDPDFLPIPDPGSRGQKGTGSRLPGPDPQHCLPQLALPLSFRPSKSTGSSDYIDRYSRYLFIEDGSEFRLDDKKKCKILYGTKKI
jgi:hypothetical protein